MADKGKVLLYYVRHIGSDTFENPELKEAFDRADVLDIEADRGISPGMRKYLRAVALGDKDKYEKLAAIYDKAYQSTKNPEMLFNKSLLGVIFNSNKRLEFEGKLRRGKRLKYLARAYRLFPELYEVRKMGFLGKGKETVKHAMMRSIADSERIARKMRLNPNHNRLVIRGAMHDVMTPLVEKRLKGTRIEVKEVYWKRPTLSRLFGAK